MKIEMWSIGKIKPYGDNPRLNDGAVDGVAASIKAFGFRQPIVVDADGVIIAGHTRYKAGQKLHLKQLPVHVAKDLTPDQVKGYRLADNRSGELAEWDHAALVRELEGLESMDGVGFEEAELEEMRDTLAVFDDMDAAPAAADGRSNLGKSHIVSLLVRIEAIGVVERAIRLTKKKNRADAIAEIFAEYLNAKGQFDLSLQAGIADAGAE